MSQPRVILVEDESLAALLMEDMLRDLGCEVVASFESLSPALEWLKGRADLPDGAVLDVNLGGEKVFPLAVALEDRGIPFVFATGYGAVECDRFANAPLLHKPVDPGALAPVIDRFGKRG
jgi:two-component SAPR family response regulator